MTPEELGDLTQVIDAQKQQTEAQLSRLLQREAQIRALLSEMAQKFEQGTTHPADELNSMKGLGAYQAWVDFSRRRRAALNRDLAGVLLEKSKLSAILRHQLGRRDALEMLTKDAQAQRKKKAADRQQDQTLATMMLSNSAP